MSGHLQALLDQFREQTATVRDQGTSFEKLIIRYFQGEPYYKLQVFLYCGTELPRVMRDF